MLHCLTPTQTESNRKCHPPRLLSSCSNPLAGSSPWPNLSAARGGSMPQQSRRLPRGPPRTLPPRRPHRRPPQSKTSRQTQRRQRRWPSGLQSTGRASPSVSEPQHISMMSLTFTQTSPLARGRRAHPPPQMQQSPPQHCSARRRSCRRCL